MKHTALLASLITLTLAIPALAQDKAKTTPIADPQAVRRDLYDLSLLHALQAVNFSADQIKTMKDVVDKAFEADKTRRQKDDDALRELAAEVKTAHDSALDGAPLSTDLENKVVDMQKAATARAATSRRTAVETILTAMWPTLTVTQRDQMDKQSIAFYGARRIPAAYKNDPKKAPLEEIQKLAAGAFVENVLLDDRVPALLAALKPLKSDDSKP